jgi:hypothetical protein
MTELQLPCQFGGIDASAAVKPHTLKLRKLLSNYCLKDYCKEIDEITPIFRIDGKLDKFNFRGCEKLRLQKKQRYITVDVGFPQSEWENKSEEQIKKFIYNSYLEAITLILIRLKKEKIEIKSAELLADLETVKKDFLKQL